ncbi:MAG: transposase [Deltaproteobacteria bacterium]|nr:transposase [Deltaproteobacteria bacterium]
MPRQARLDMPGALHHIMVRGLNKTDIFIDDQDKEQFLQRLGDNIIEGKCLVFAWTLMDNHVHILFRSGQQGLSSVMRKLLTWYAQYFNRRHNRRGHLFENRYKSILCQEEAYLLALIRYVHLNPLRAGMIKNISELDDYPWSGHSAIMGRKQCPWMDVDYILRQFGEYEKAARSIYRSFMEEGVGLGSVPELAGGGLVRSLGGWSHVVSARRKGEQSDSDERILGAGDFVNKILEEAEAREARQLKLRRKGVGIAEIIADECRKSGISSDELSAGSRRSKVSQARELIALRGVKEFGFSAAEMARSLGVNTSSITRAIERAEAKLK